MTVLLRYLPTRDGRDRTARSGGESEAKWIFMIKKKGQNRQKNVNSLVTFCLGP